MELVTAAADGVVDQTIALKHFRLVQVTTIKDHRMLEGAGHHVEIRGAEFFPLGADGQGIGTFEACSLVPHRVRPSWSPEIRWVSSMASGSKACTVATAFQTSSSRVRAEASRMSSVFGLKASPHKAMTLPFRSPWK